MTPEMIFIDSSNIEAIGFDPEAAELHVHFHSSGQYVYHEVPQDVFDALLESPSKGSFLNREIKPFYTFTKQ